MRSRIVGVAAPVDRVTFPRLRRRAGDRHKLAAFFDNARSPKAWQAARAAGWLCLLPILIKIYTLPGLLKRLTAVPPKEKRAGAAAMEDAVNAALWVSKLRLFRLPLFPRPCLRQSLVLYRTLSRMGYPVEIHFGVRKQGADLYGHSWVTTQGSPVAEPAVPEDFRAVYSYSSAEPNEAMK